MLENVLLVEDNNKKEEFRKDLKSKANKNGKKPRNFRGKFNFKGFIMLAFIVTLFMGLPSLMNKIETTPIKEVAYSEFITEVKSAKILSVEEDEGWVYGFTSNEDVKKDKDERTGFKARMITDRLGGDENLVSTLTAANIQVGSVAPAKLPFIVDLLVSWFPMLLLIGVWVFMLGRMNKGGGSGGPQIFNIGKSKVKENGETITQVTFKDVAGIDEAKVELEEVVHFLKEPEKYRKLGAKIPKGVLLLGAPGTGKTLLAKAVAGEAGVPFMSISGSEFVEMFVGVGASRVRDLFAKARKVAPCIVFIDEIDAVGRKRGSGQGGGNDEREQTLNQLLVEMDGFGNEETIIIIAATNRAEILDRALLRPGRFDRQVVVEAPDIKGREEILKVHTRNKKFEPDVDLGVLARKTPGFVGADLANLLNEAAILAAREGRDCISMDDLEEASEKVTIGPERKSKVTLLKERQIIAYHEVGHALTQLIFPLTDPVHKVTIVPRGSAALGYTMSLPTEDRYLKSKNEYLSEIRVLLGGRAAEKVVFGDITTGASNDIERATAIAHAMVTRFGMNDKFGPILLDSTRDGDMFPQKNYSETTGKEIDDEIRKIIVEAYNDSINVLTENRDKLEYISQTLLERETINGEELLSLFRGEKLPDFIKVERKKPVFTSTENVKPINETPNSEKTEENVEEEDVEFKTREEFETAFQKELKKLEKEIELRELDRDLEQESILEEELIEKEEEEKEVK